MLSTSIDTSRRFRYLTPILPARLWRKLDWSVLRMKGIPHGMKGRFVGLVVLCCAIGIILSFSGSDRGQSQTAGTPVNDGLSQDARDLLSEINQARAHPQQYAPYLERLKPLFHGQEYQPSNQDSFRTQEGWSAVEDAIKFLRTAKPLDPLSMSHGLCLAALSHVKDQSGTGNAGHKGADSSLIEQRVKPFGSWQGGIGENLTYGSESARERILTWLIDDGFPGRGHRLRLMSSDYKVAGVCCGRHPQFRSMCVVTLAGGFVDSPAAKTEARPQTRATPVGKPTPENKTPRDH
jgi:uncharacterized protein YkwD